MELGVQAALLESYVIRAFFRILYKRGIAFCEANNAAT